MDTNIAPGLSLQHKVMVVARVTASLLAVMMFLLGISNLASPGLITPILQSLHILYLTVFPLWIWAIVCFISSALFVVNAVCVGRRGDLTASLAAFFVAVFYFACHLIFTVWNASQLLSHHQAVLAGTVLVGGATYLLVGVLLIAYRLMRSYAME